MSNKVFIIYDYASAKEYYRIYKNQNNQILTLCLTASNFFETKNINSKYFLDNLTLSEEIDCYEKADLILSKILKDLDNRFAEAICKNLQINKQKVFFSIYRFPFTERLASLMKFDILMNNYLSDKANSYFEFFLIEGYENTSIFSISSYIQYRFKKKNNFKINLVKNVFGTQLSTKQSFGRKIKKIKSIIKYYPEVIKSIRLFFKDLFQNKNTNKGEIMFFDECKFFEPFFKNLNSKIIYINKLKLKKNKYLNKKIIETLNFARAFTEPSDKNSTNTIGNFFETNNLKRKIINNLIQNFDNYFSLLMANKNTLDFIKIGCWVYPPSLPKTRLILDYLINNGTEVWGRQHGDTYMQKRLYEGGEGRHFDSDYNCCHYWYSYGLTEKNYTSIYSNQYKKLAKIVPTFYDRKKKINKPLNADIVFIPRVNISFYDYGTQSTTRDHWKFKLVNKLNKIKNKKIFIKLVPSRLYETNSLYDFIKSKKNIFIEENVSFDTFSKYHNIKLAIFEELNTCLLPILDQPTVIFALHYPDSIFYENIYNLLKKRVYFFNKFNELNLAINNFIEGNTSFSFDDHSFDEMYLSKNISTNVMNEINSKVKETIKNEKYT